MGIDSESDVPANLVVGPTSAGMVRIYIEAEGVDLPMDFEPEEALEIADELRAAAEAAANMRQGKARGGGGKTERPEADKGEGRKHGRRSR